MTMDGIRGACKVREGYWFVPKKFGYGATPVTWQGWAVTLGFAGAILAAMRILPTVTEKVIVTLVLVVTMVAIAAAKTDGKWRWRSGRR